MTEHGQGYEDSGRPMMVIAEVWPVAADELGLWLLSGDGPRPSLPVMDDAEPFDYAEMELMQAGMWATTKILHSTSWRADQGDLLRGQPKGVASQASDQHRRGIGITLFDCPGDSCHLPRRGRVRGPGSLPLAGCAAHQRQGR
jgi:hypothetical protein